VILTIWADGVHRTKPVIIFHGKGQRIPQTERTKWDPRVYVEFQQNAWADEDIMRKYFLFHFRQMDYHQQTRLMVMDVHKAQKTESIKNIVRNVCNTIMALIPPGSCCSLWCWTYSIMCYLRTNIYYEIRLYITCSTFGRWI